METWLDRLRYRVSESGLGLMVLLFLIAALATASFLERDVERRARKAPLVVATITDLGIGVSKSRPGATAWVVAHDETGSIGRDSVDAAFMAGCRVGDRIQAKRTGAELVLEPMPCR